MTEKKVKIIGLSLRILVYVMLATSAIASLLFSNELWQAVRTEAVPFWVALLPILIFTLFVLVYAGDRLWLVRRRGYPPMRALGQIIFALIFVTLIWPQQATKLRQSREHLPQRSLAVSLLYHSDAKVRSAGCQWAAERRDAETYDRIRQLAQKDRHPMVREYCQAALTTLQPQDDIAPTPFLREGLVEPLPE